MKGNSLIKNAHFMEIDLSDTQKTRPFTLQIVIVDQRIRFYAIVTSTDNFVGKSIFELKNILQVNDISLEDIFSDHWPTILGPIQDLT